MIDGLAEDDARAALARCCGARRWVDGMLARRPFGSREALHAAAREVWSVMGDADILEAFAHHPEIGADPAALRARFPATQDLSSAEQAGVAGADPATLNELGAANRAYRARFGYTFIVCATGKSAREMLAAVRARLDNDPGDELRIAAGEQAKITALRLEAIGP
jgi:2-oxo-4-hydroxy-4-carboxy-5-ureidoimidazoline decarboxylase